MRRPRDRPVRGAGGDVGGRARIVRKAQRGALPECGDFERKIGAAHAGAGNGAETNDAYAFRHRAGIEALYLRFVAPRLALGEEETAAAPRKRCQHAKHRAACETPTHHGGRMRWSLLTALQGLRAPRNAQSAPRRYG